MHLTQKMGKKGLIIINLGSPDSYSVKDVKIYLREFLMDEKVMDVPSPIRSLLVKGFIIPFRAKNSAEAYKTIWTDMGSPLKVITQEFSEQVQKQLDMPVVVSMRYGSPTPEAALAELERKNDGPLDEILITPMYPHYAMSSYETALDYMRDYILSKRKNVKLRVLKPFYNEPGYIASLAESIRPYLNKQNFDAYLFSYHGLPIRHLKKSDVTGKHCYMSGDCCELKSIAWQTCYKHQVKETTRLVIEKLQLDPSKVKLSFQSRLEGDKWLQPYTDKYFEDLPKQGVKKLLVLCPAFVADCLETLEEINVRGKESFIENGGEQLVNVPCMNTNTTWVNTFVAYCKEYEGRYAALWN
jgi:protoporphyrin/coproporphyrin ferrochelatase